MSALTSKQRQYLKGVAHSLSPVVRVGKAGVTEAVVAETATALRAHELIKVRIEADEGAERRASASELASAASAALVGTVGKIAILYKAREEDPDITLPS